MGLRVDTPPPAKKDWHNPLQKSRGEWSQVFECVSSWFCRSHGFNHHHDLVVEVGSYHLEIRGDEVRYLAPSLRSAASLIHKAYQSALTLDQGEVIESTPGVYAHVGRDMKYPKPYYRISLSNSADPMKITEGTIFGYLRDTAEVYHAPASVLSQALIWIQLEGKL